MRTYFRPFTLSDLPRVLNLQLRQADVDEIRASTGISPAEALASSVAWSERVWVVIHDGEIEAVFGVAPTYSHGIPWFLATDKFKEFRITFAKESIQVVDELLALYGKLSNFVDYRHKESIRWLRWLGFTVDVRNPFYFQDDKVPFYLFVKEASADV